MKESSGSRTYTDDEIINLARNNRGYGMQRFCKILYPKTKKLSEKRYHLTMLFSDLKESTGEDLLDILEDPDNAELVSATEYKRITGEKYLPRGFGRGTGGRPSKTSKRYGKGRKKVGDHKNIPLPPQEFNWNYSKPVSKSKVGDWTHPDYSRNRVNKAGEELRKSSDPFSESEEIEVVNNWKASHELPLHYVRRTVSRYAEEIAPNNCTVVQRRKRNPSIIMKLQRMEKTHLSRMQDLVGMRVVFRHKRSPATNLSLIDELSSMLEKSRMASEIKTVTDYIKTPKPDTGYRSKHIIYRFKTSNEKYLPHQNMLVELQIRTYLQHAWATAVESFGMFNRDHLKQGEAKDQNWIRFFKLMSHFISLEERTPPVISGINKGEAKRELRDIAEYLDARESLRRFAKLNKKILQHKQSGRIHLKTRGFVLMRLNTRDEKVDYHEFESRLVAGSEIQSKYDEWESRARADPDIHVLLVKTEDHNDLIAGFPNYFVDTRVFGRRLDRYTD